MSLGGAVLNQINFHKSLSHQKDMLKMQQDFAVNMAKNKHSYEVESLLKAGLNPALAHGTTELVGSPSAPSAPSAPSQKLDSRGLSDIEMSSLQADARSKLAIARQQEADAVIKEIDAVTRQEDNLATIAVKKSTAGLNDEMKAVTTQKLELLKQFDELGGVQSYLDNQGSQTSLQRSTAALRDVEKNYVGYNAFSRRLEAQGAYMTGEANKKNADTNAYDAETRRFLARSQHGVNNAILREKRAVTQREWQMANYYGACMALTKTQQELAEVEKEARKALGPVYAASMVVMKDVMALGEQGVGIAMNLKSKGMKGAGVYTTNTTAGVPVKTGNMTYTVNK